MYGNSLESYLDFYENDYLFRQAYDSIVSRKCFGAALGQNICKDI